MKTLTLAAICSLMLVGCDPVEYPVKVVYPDAGQSCPATSVIYVYVNVGPDAGTVECPPQPVCQTPADAGTPDDDGPCEHGKHTGNPHCD